MSNSHLVPTIQIETTANDREADFVAPSHGSAQSLGGSPFLHVRPSRSPSTQSLDGETLRSRSESFSTQAPLMLQISTKEALQPDRGTEKSFDVANNPFAFSPGQLNKLVDPKSTDAFHALGGIQGLERGLRTDLTAGLHVHETRLDGSVSFEEATSTGSVYPNSKHSLLALGSDPVIDGSARSSQYESRTRVFGKNALPEKKATSIWTLIWTTYNDKVLILLTVAAVVSLALGLYETFGGERKPGDPAPVDWIEGVAICVAILIVIVVGAFNDWQKERQFIRLNRKKEDREVKALRSGKSVMISVYDIVVGDVLHLEPGDVISADGIFIDGHNVRCDESSATGESDQMKKTPAHEALRLLNKGAPAHKIDPFIISGSKILEGVGTYLVTSVGVHSFFGKTMMALQEKTDPTPLQVKLAGLAGNIAKLGGSAALLLFTVLLIRFLADLPGNTASPSAKASAFLDILIVAVTIIVVAVPEGLPLAVTLALAFATTRMMKENNLVRLLRACETMGNATTICSDKTGTLTQNKMMVVAGTIGTDAKFSQSGATVAEDGEKVADAQPATAVTNHISENVKRLCLESIAVNSTAFEGEDHGVQSFIGSKTETAMLIFARDFLGMGPLSEERANSTVVQLFPFDSSRKCMGVVVKLASGRYRFLVKGASEILLAQCGRELRDISTEYLDEEIMSESSRTRLSGLIDSYAKNSLRTIALVYREFEQWPPINARTTDEGPDSAVFEDLFQDMTFLALVGIRDPLREGVTEAVKSCQNAGVTVRMVTGDNVTTATAIATECGIKTEEGIVMEGPEFRKLTEEEMDAKLPLLQVLARSSPEDKRTLVARLKYLGETVAVTGDGTNDAPALKTADIGFSMGIAGTEVAKEASSIILMDDNFASIVKAIMWGRAVNDAVAKFLQFQLTVNITAVLLAFVSAVSSPDSHSVLSAVQLLWVNLIMDTLAALALATDAPRPSILDRKPTPKRAPLISTNMWKMILGQAVYQLLVTFVLYFAGAQMLGYDKAAQRQPTPELRAKKAAELDDQLNTIVFNTFVWMQIFNMWNNRRLDNKSNIFEGAHRNWFLLIINAIMFGGQVMIVFIGGRAFQVTRLDGGQWAICIICALFCLPWAVVVRLIPDPAAARGIDAVVRGFAFIFSPVVKLFRLTNRVFFSPVKRTVGRAGRKVFRKRADAGEKEDMPKDEEAAPQLNEKISDSSDQRQGSPLHPPPITVTNPQ